MNFKEKLLEALTKANGHNSNVMVKPEVILWPDPEGQWAEIIPILQAELSHLLVYGIYDQSKKQGPAIWLKCMVAQTLPEANWPNTQTPIIYLPGVTKNDLRNVQVAGLDFQPLIEYQYTGTIFTQENGKEWTILAFLQNSLNGLGLSVAQDNATKEALKKALPNIFQDSEILANRRLIDAEYINNVLFPDIIPNILRWICKGDEALSKMDSGKKEVFFNLCKSQYDFEPDHKNIKAIVERLGSQRNSWKYVWQHYANAPKKYPEMVELLRFAKPEDLSSGMFAIPEESWPQVNEAKEDELRKSLAAISKLLPNEATKKIKTIQGQHGFRKNWVWSELGQAPLVNALYYILQMSENANEPYSSSTIDEMQNYYTTKGFLVDQAMRKSLASVKAEKDKTIIKSIIITIYKPWLENLTQKFQALIAMDASIFTTQSAKIETESFVLFIDAFRFELAEEFSKLLVNSKYSIELQTGWSAIPSLTPTAKPNISPIASVVSTESVINEFRPHLKSGKDLQTTAFRESLTANNFILVTNPSDIKPGQNHWQEIGDIDTKGHEEQSEMVKRIDELFEQVLEIIEVAFEKGIKKIKIVTDHGWLLLPGGLPKEELKKDLVETRWGRCALIKEGVKTELLHLPWRWNPTIFIAYAPSISFFKANEEYAHGGISIHECLVPLMIVENSGKREKQPKFEKVKWVNLKCIVQVDDAPEGYSIDIRTKYNDRKSSIVISSNKLLINNSVSLFVDDEAESMAATIVILDEYGRIIDDEPTKVGG
jgi:hypothetical protein